MRYNIGNFWKGRKQPLSVRKKNSESLKLAYQEGKHKKGWENKHFSKSHKLKIKQSNIKTWESLKLRNSVDKIMTEWWKDHPNIKKKVSDRMKKYYKNNPKAFQTFMNGGKTNKKLNKKTLEGYKVRSYGEQKIANFLYKNKIKSYYEKYILFIEDWLCTPDFYLKNENVFIEYYGGYYKSRKKKIIKNRIYRAHRIPFIAVTPSELRDLNKYLYGDAKKIKNKTMGWKKFIIR